MTEKHECKTPLFSLGLVVFTPNFLSLEINSGPLLQRHARGDWGDMEQEDKDENQRCLELGERLFSAYNTPKGRVWIITERDRSVTTVLLPEDY